MSQRWLRSALGRRFAVRILMFSSVVTLAATALQLGIEYRRDVGDIRSQLSLIRASYADSLASSLWSISTDDLQLQLDGILRMPDLQQVRVLNDTGQIVAQAGKPAQGGDTERIDFPLTYLHDERPMYLGHVEVTASLEGVYRRLRDKVVVILAAQTVKTFLVSMFILALFQFTVGRYLERITDYANSLFAGHEAPALRLGHRGDELEQIAVALSSVNVRLRTAFAALQESESRWKFALEGAGDGVWDYDLATGNVVYSPRWKEMLGYADHELPNSVETYRRLCHPDDLEASTAALEACARGETPFYHAEQRMRCKDGHWMWVLARGMVVQRDAEGNGIRMIGTHADITERREANAIMERTVAERTEQLEAANRELEAFSYSVSHDLRSPLRGINGWAQALEEDYGAAMDDTARDYLARVRAEARRMGQLIDDMLRFSQLGRTALSLGPVDLTALARREARRLAELHPKQTILWQIEDGLRATADAGLMAVVLANLLENAVKFSAGEPLSGIEVGRSPATPQHPAAFFVRDNGAGFDMRHADKLFGVFQRLHRHSEFPGTGIGLATVRRILHRHGGEIWAQSSPGHGATFYFTLKEMA